MDDEIARRIREVKEKGLKVLDLTALSGDTGLNSIPSEVFDLTQLEELNLFVNPITTLPDEIGNLRNLRVFQVGASLTYVSDAICELKELTSLLLYADESQQVRLPSCLSQLKKLTDLRLLGFNLPAPPTWLGELEMLRVLNLGANGLTVIPSWMDRLGGLESLSLVSNRLRSLPELSSLQRLKSLVLSHNQFTELPETVLSLHNLEYLQLDLNSLSDLPPAFGDLKKLTDVGLGGNKFTHIPDCVYELASLKSFSIGNWIRQLSPRILGLKNLEKIYLDPNPIETPPAEIVDKGIGAIREYFRQLEVEGTDHLYEAKLLIVGEGGAGKTSLANKIKNPDYVLKEEDTTKGIEVIRWTFPMDSQQTFSVNIWDFGGQEIYHATHQFFLTRRSLYVLVADTRKEDTDFYYWLNVVSLLSDGSPLLIVKNEKQDRQREINVNQLRGQFSNLEKTLPTNLADNRGLSDIVESIKHYITHLPQIGTPLPKTWVKVRDVLEKDSRNHIPITEYLRVCQDNGFTELKDKMQLLGYLHDLGVCLNFQNDPLLKKAVILKPKWGTDAVYKVLDNKRVIANFGRFNRDDLGNIWREPEYAEMQDELLQLMINFRLCYRIPNADLYIAPQLLTENQPAYEWDEKNNLILRYTYEFMPKGIVTQFIVAMHRLIARQDHVWKSGVILASDGTMAEVIEYYGKREIKVRVAGKHKKETMAVVTYELDKIHSSYAGLKYTKLIPCNCSQCATSETPHFYRFETLQRFADNRREEIQCEMSFDMVNVRGLIDDVITPYVNLESLRSLSEPPRPDVFISYSHADRGWLDALLTMLKPLTRTDRFSIWADTEIKGGSKWKDEIEKALNSARVAVLLVSSTFLASDFIAEHELPPMLRAAGQRGLRILWVPVSSSMYKETEIADYQAASDPSKPLDTLSAAEAKGVLVSICEQIKEAANR